MKKILCCIQYRKPSNLVEIFSACKFYNINQLIIFCSNKNKNKIKKYINSFKKEEINFKIKINQNYKIPGIKNFFFKKKINYFAIQGDHLKAKILGNFTKKKIIGLTDGVNFTYSALLFYLTAKVKNLLDFIKMPLTMSLEKIFKCDIIFSYFYDHKLLYGKKIKPNYNFELNETLFKKLKLKKIKKLIAVDKDRSLSSNEVIRRYNLNIKNTCIIERDGTFKIANTLIKNISVIPEMILSSNLITEVFCNEISSITAYAIKKKIKIKKVENTRDHTKLLKLFKFLNYFIKRKKIFNKI